MIHNLIATAETGVRYNRYSSLIYGFYIPIDGAQRHLKAVGKLLGTNATPIKQQHGDGE
ncbi:hypothetical protein D3C85_1243750 [compost metagenome]